MLDHSGDMDRFVIDYTINAQYDGSPVSSTSSAGRWLNRLVKIDQ